MKINSPTPIPKLPVPPLEHTLRFYLRTLKPLLNKEEYEENVNSLEKFLLKDSLGWTLWKRLLEKAQISKTSWLYDLWNEYAYMSVRDPLVPASSYYFAFNDEQDASQAKRAALIVINVLKYRDIVLEKKLQPEMQQGNTLCMKQYDYLFHTCRIPAKKVDICYKCPDPENHRYFSVVCNDCYYLVHFKDTHDISVDELEKIFSDIVDTSKSKSNTTSIGHLTLLNRDAWAQEYELLLKDKDNERFLSSIKKSAFLVCLDSGVPNNEQSLSEACYLSDGRNRFNDKSLQFIIFKNGKAGFLGEHSMMDAIPTRNICEYILTTKVDSTSRGNSIYVNSNLTTEPLKSNVYKVTENKALEAIEGYNQMVKSKSIKVLLFNDFGKEEIKSLGISPDSFVQMAFQLAYYSLHKKFCTVYESASSRLFQYGRTETIRCLSEESKKWVLLMNDRSSSDTERYNALIDAIKYHKFYAGKCLIGEGVDRLLLGLKNEIRDGETLPSLLSNPALKSSSHWVLSTSQVYSENFSGYGWSNVVEDGYGLPYNIKKYQICITVVCTLPLRAEHLAEHIESSLKTMHSLAKKHAKPLKFVPKL